MASYSLAQAKDQLSRLVDEAVSGESVVITRHGKPVAVIAPAPAGPKPITKAFLAGLARRRALRPSGGGDSVTLVRQMRDEEP